MVTLTYLKEEIKNQGYSIIGISKNLEIEYRTLQRWIKYENVEYVIKFLKLLKKLDITIDQFIEEYEQEIKKEG